MTTSRLVDLIREAPAAVESFHPGHWGLMQRLERTAPEVLASQNAAHLAGFLVNVAFLKQPFRIDKAEVLARLLECPSELHLAIDALKCVPLIGYKALEILAKLPYFGRSGGRSFGSAVLRIVAPASFGIIDWRNLAVLCGAPGFQGLIDPPARFAGLDGPLILQRKGHLEFSRELYLQYNERLREIAAACLIPKVADIDLALWTFSIQRCPFVARGPTLFESFWNLSPEDRTCLKNGGTRPSLIAQKLNDYLTSLQDIGALTRERVQAELRAIFAFIKNECNHWGRAHPYAILEVIHTNRALDEAIKSATDNRLVAKWRRWEGMVDPASMRYRGISMPSSMIVDGYVVFEDLAPIRDYFESMYDDGTFELKSQPV